MVICEVTADSIIDVNNHREREREREDNLETHFKTFSPNVPLPTRNSI